MDEVPQVNEEANDYLEKYEGMRTSLLHLFAAGDYFFYDYSRSEFYNNFNDLFKFVYNNIDQKWDAFKIKPCYFFYNNSDLLDAKANPKERFISINRGLLERLKLFFEKYQEFVNGLSKERQPLLYEKLDTPVDHLMFQMAGQFCYYHELGHIIQYSDNNVDKTFTESAILRGNNTFDLMDHVMEMDADLFAAHYVLNHVVDYWKKLPEEVQNQETLQMLVSLIVASMFLLFFVLAGEEAEDIYCFEGDHPHYIVRIIYTNVKIMEGLKTYSKQQGL